MTPLPQNPGRSLKGFPHPDPDLSRTLQNLEKRYLTREFLASDPVEFPWHYTQPRDREIVALISSLFAYGNVRAMKHFLERLFSNMDPSPWTSFRGGGIHRTELFYRFQNSRDVASLLEAIHSIVASTPGDEASDSPIFESLFGQMGDPLDQRIDIAREALLNRIPAKRHSRGLLHLIGKPGLNANSPRKRFCMFLRWMVRREFPDFGIYKSFLPKELVLPLDVHMARMVKRLGFSSRNRADWKTATQATATLRLYDPEDPLRFDFVLTRPGITGRCRPGHPDRTCAICELKHFCQEWDGSENRITGMEPD